jgi:hypothetical protein
MFYVLGGKKQGSAMSLPTRPKETGHEVDN